MLRNDICNKKVYLKIWRCYVMMDTKSMKKIPETVRVSKRNAERLVSVGKFGESFDDVIGRLLDHYEKQEKKK